MNERIRQLREQAWTLVSNEERDRGELYEAREQWERCDQKFAELIVQECTMLLFNESERLSELYSEEANWKLAEEHEICSNQCINDIALLEKHFGVE